MYLDADQLPDGVVLAGFDICIVGAGAAGIAMAQRLAGSSLKVLVVTSGLRNDAGQPTNPDPRWEIYNGTLGSFMKQVDSNFLMRSRLNMYGGTTNHFAFYAHPLAEEDLLPRSGYRDAHWPLSIEELNGYYPAANAFGNYGPFNYDDIAFWAKAMNCSPLPALPNDPLQNLIWHAQLNSNIYQFQTQFGQSLQTARNVTVLFNASVLRIETTPGRESLTGLGCATIDQNQPGIHFGVAARRYVLAQGGIEPVRLLKLSGNLGDNAKGHLGRGFMLHPLIQQAASVTVPTTVVQSAQNFYQQQTVVLKPQPSADGSVEYQPVRPLPYHAGELTSLPCLTVWGMLGPTPAVVAQERIGSFHSNLSFAPGKTDDSTTVTISINWESVPNEDSTITLDESQRDPVFGQPVVQLDWRLLEQEKRTVRRGLELFRQYFAARQGQDFEITTDLEGGPEQWTFSPLLTNPMALQAGDHHMGALRMSALPEDGIVDPNLKVHTVENLYIAGSGVYPTTGHANPTLTIVALALRLADHLQALSREP